MNEEQINDTSSEVVETQTPEEAFEAILTADESTDQPDAEVEHEEVEEEEVLAEGTDTEDEIEEVEEELYEEESEEDEPEAERTYTVKAAGEEREVTESELIKSYQLGTDYTKKSQVLAEQAKIVEENAGKIYQSMQVRDEYAQKLGQIEQILNEESATEEDLVNMKENDPVGYAVRIAEQTENQRKMKLIQQERQMVAARQAQDKQEIFATQVAHESEKLTSLMPEFSDKAKGEQIKKDIRSYGTSVGFTDQEMGTVYDARHVLILNKAMKYDRLVKNKGAAKKQVNNAPRMAKRGTKQAKGKSDTYNKQRAQLKNSGNQSDAVSVFENILRGN